MACNLPIWNCIDKLDPVWVSVALIRFMIALGRRISGFRRLLPPLWLMIEAKIDLIFGGSTPADVHLLLPDFAVTERSLSNSCICHAPFGTYNLFALHLHVAFESITQKPFRTFVVVPRTFDTLLIALQCKPARMWRLLRTLTKKPVQNFRFQTVEEHASNNWKPSLQFEPITYALSNPPVLAVRCSRYLKLQMYVL